MQPLGSAKPTAVGLGPWVGEGLAVGTTGEGLGAATVGVGAVEGDGDAAVVEELHDSARAAARVTLVMYFMYEHHPSHGPFRHQIWRCVSATSTLMHQPAARTVGRPGDELQPLAHRQHVRPVSGRRLDHGAGGGSLQQGAATRRAATRTVTVHGAERRPARCRKRPSEKPPSPQKSAPARRRIATNPRKHSVSSPDGIRTHDLFLERDRRVSAVLGRRTLANRAVLGKRGGPD